MTLRTLLLAFCLGALAVARAAPEPVLVQSTTSTQNSGLFAWLFPAFTDETGIEVRVVAVGTGQALKNAARGDGDVVIVHAREAELAFVAAGHGLERHDLMYNDFVIVGPASDPAGVATASGAAEALTRIARNRARFLSRGDSSGTHMKERALWRAAGIDPAPASGRWYWETGTGMGATLNIAAGKSGYTLTDRATWLAFGNKGALKILYAGDPALYNQYGVIQVNPARHPNVNAQGARRLVEWLISDEGQARIGAYRVDGEQLFFPNASGR